MSTPKERLEYLRGQLRAECISYGELAELQSLAEYIEPGDVELLEAAGVPEFPEERGDIDTETALADLRRIAAWLAEDTDDDEAQGAASDLLRVADWFATGQFE